MIPDMKKMLNVPKLPVQANQKIPHWMAKKIAKNSVYTIDPRFSEYNSKIEDLPKSQRTLMTIAEFKAKVSSLDPGSPGFSEQCLKALLNKDNCPCPIGSFEETMLSLDCEMVGGGYKGNKTILARVSIADYFGNLVLDRHVAPTEPITDYRTWISGITKEDLVDAPSFDDVKTQVQSIISGKFLIGHDIQNDLKALKLTHPQNFKKDTRTDPLITTLSKTNSLRILAYNFLDLKIQASGHSSVIDALATMGVFRKLQTLDRTKAPPMLKRKQPEPADESLPADGALFDIDSLSLTKFKS